VHFDLDPGILFLVHLFAVPKIYKIFSDEPDFSIVTSLTYSLALMSALAGLA